MQHQREAAISEETNGDLGNSMLGHVVLDFCIYSEKFYGKAMPGYRGH
jgi:hypothetical protein